MSSAIHISLNVSDLDRSVDFYRRLFGEPRKLKPGYAKFVAEEPEIHLALQPGRPAAAREGSLSHLGIRVDSTEKVRAWREALSRRGLQAGKVEREDCCYATQDKFWVADPDGNSWEVYTVLQDVETEPACAQTSCCAR